MPRRPKTCIACEHYTWNVYNRSGIAYADGRGNKPNLGKHSLGVRSNDNGAVMEALRDLDRQMAIDNGLIEETAKDRHDSVNISKGWEKYMTFCRRPTVLGGAGPATNKRYKAVCDKHQRFCQEKGIATWNEIDKKSVEQYAHWLERKGYADASIYLECTLLKQIVKWLIEEERCLPETNRFRLKLERSDESDTYCYSPEQVTAMVDRCRSVPGLGWLAPILVTLATTGMRIGELCNLRWSDIDLPSNMITLPDNRHSGRRKKQGKTVRKNKGKRTRKVPIHPDLRKVLVDLPRRADGRVFGGPRGGFAKPDTIRTIFVRSVVETLKEEFPTPDDEMGFEHGRLHSFRHFFVSQAFLGGASEGEIREWVGHADSRIVERYRHLGNEDAQRKMERISFLGEKNVQQDGAQADDQSDEQGEVKAPEGPAAT